MYDHQLHQRINQILQQHKIDIAGKDNFFYVRMMANADSMYQLYKEIYGTSTSSEKHFSQLVGVMIHAYQQRSATLKKKEKRKQIKATGS